MPVISILNPKGGCGKTTLSINLARAFHDRGFRVLLVDSDPQGSASDWHATRDDNPLSFIAYGKPENLKALPGIATDYDYVFIDGAAKLEGMIAATVKVSDAILIPVQPSPFDVWAISDLVDLIRARQEVTDGNPQAAFVVSRVIKRTLLGREVNGALAECGFPVLESPTIQRQIYPRTASDGLSVFDSAEREAAVDMIAIADEVEGIFSFGKVCHVA